MAVGGITGFGAEDVPQEHREIRRQVPGHVHQGQELDCEAELPVQVGVPCHFLNYSLLSLLQHRQSTINNICRIISRSHFS